MSSQLVSPTEFLRSSLGPLLDKRQDIGRPILTVSSSSAPMEFIAAFIFLAGPLCGFYFFLTTLYHGFYSTLNYLTYGVVYLGFHYRLDDVCHEHPQIQQLN
jgi:hypothetical protein